MSNFQWESVPLRESIPLKESVLSNASCVRKYVSFIQLTSIIDFNTPGLLLEWAVFAWANF